MKNKLLYIGNKIQKVSSGADQINKRNQDCLEHICSVTYIPYIKGKFSKLYLSVTNNYLKQIDQILIKGHYDYIFIQQSLLGRVCKFIKQKYPNIKIIVFFHNVEVQYAREYIKTKGIRAFPFYFTVLYWEKICCKYADYCITLNNRDSLLLNTIYNKKSHLILPTSFQDKFNKETSINVLQNREDEIIDYLFVGVSFFANIEAVQWFIDNVMPHVEGHFYIVGKGMDKITFNNMTEKVHIYGFVDDLSKFYYRAKMVISPIHVGGGMKTKTAEALMYGKTILGSSEAFEGYDIDERCMVICNTVEDYIREINKRTNDHFLYNQFARKLFINNYSNNIILQKFISFFNSIKG